MQQDFNKFDEDGMELPPLRNKEVLSEKETFRVSKLKYKVAIWTSVFSFAGLVVTSLIPFFTTIFTNEQKALLREAEQQKRVQRVIDSITEIEDQKQVERTYNDIAAIYEQLNRLQRLLPRAASIAIYSTHDSGGIPRSGSPLHVTILYQTANNEMTSGKEYWQKRVIPEGYFNFNRYIYENGEYYIEDVLNHPSVYNAETKEDMDFNGTKSIYGHLIKSTPKEIYYLAVTYKETNPVMNVNPNLKNVIRVYSSKFEKLLK